MGQEEHSHYFDSAIEQATLSRCKRAQCGSVVIKDGAVIGHGYNGPPRDDSRNSRCLKKHEIKPGFKSDKTCCVHAEQRAIMDAVARHPDKVKGARIYFIRLDEKGKPEPAGSPYCTICSKLALDSGIAEFVLWHKNDVNVYDTKEYNDLSYAYNGG